MVAVVVGVSVFDGNVIPPFSVGTDGFVVTLSTYLLSSKMFMGIEHSVIVASEVVVVVPGVVVVVVIGVVVVGVVVVVVSGVVVVVVRLLVPLLCHLLASECLARRRESHSYVFTFKIKKYQ